MLLLAEYFNRQLATRHALPPRRFTAGAQALLCAHRWPGNARELKNVVESLLLMTRTEAVTAEDLHAVIGVPPAEPDAAPATIGDAERAAIRRALADNAGNVAAAARRLGVSRSTLYRKAARFGIAL